MLFLINFKTALPTKRVGQQRFKEAGGAAPPPGITHHGSYHYVDGSGGVLIVETDDAVLLGGWANEWADVVELDVRPVLTDPQVGQILAKAL